MDNIRVSFLYFLYLGIPGFTFLDSPKNVGIYGSYGMLYS